MRNITSVLREINNPNHHFKIIHIAGTNGKGSTAALVESVLRSAGYKTGLFTSPHLFDFTERIRVAGKPIPRRQVSSGIALLKPYIERYRCTFFEATTALAFQIFQKEGVDVAIIEVGMGGRLDATNVVTSMCSIITDIDNDHTEYLGEKLKSIAREKAAVIKEKSTVVTSATQPEVKEVLRAACMKRGATLYATGEHCTLDIREISSEGSRITLQTPFRVHTDLQVPLLGRHQVRNAAAAVLAIDVLNSNGVAVSEGNVRQGIAGTTWPGRLQVLQKRPLFLVDGAHNPGGMHALKDALQEFFTYKNLILVFGVMSNKSYTEMLRAIVPMAHHVLLTRPNMERALNCRVLAEEVSLLTSRFEVIPSVSQAVRRAFTIADPGDVVCAAGSLFLVGDILKSRMKRVDELFGLN
ncbi:MAG: bifunctional folylpolyglutamate synthase/dihydrofolate synthase [Gemmatimonadota bacterium]|nr:MAG: bifunctional folylpolyglutamate synthase/dihydrofolate synthase [Gemmatimonadota bacterium]